MDPAARMLGACIVGGLFTIVAIALLAPIVEPGIAIGLGWLLGLAATCVVGVAGGGR